jgi:hypothetical protein
MMMKPYINLLKKASQPSWQPAIVGRNAPMQTRMAGTRMGIICARDYFQKALELSREGKDKFATMSFLSHLGTAVYFLDDIHQMEALFQESLALARETNSTGWVTGALLGVGVASNRLGKSVGATDYFLEALSLSQMAKDPDRYEILACLVDWQEERWVQVFCRGRRRWER